LYFYYGVSVQSLILNQNSVNLTILPQKLGQPTKLQWSDSIAAQQWKINNQSVTSIAKTPNTLEISGIFNQPILTIKGQLATDAEPDSFNLSLVNSNQYFLDKLRQIFDNEGIKVNQGLIATANQRDSQETELTLIKSPTLANLLQTTNQESNNLFAEVFLQILGRELKSETGLDAIKNSLTDLGVDPDSYHLVDGSGLSRHNLVSPEALVQTLRLMSQTQEGQTYRQSLAVAGISGTLKTRFINTPIQGKLSGKTGTLSGNIALSGYLETPHYQPLVFSIVVNQSEESAADLRQAIDEIILQISRLQNCQYR
jgi:D-alanyl-D-alanine carboxypeptidase/D-alanyl-D-alanine-endopeptidase (penicillin-binding protein 4)